MPIDLGTLPGDTASVALGLNSQGEVVGYSAGNGILHAFIWSPSTGMQQIGASDNSVARSINDQGAVVGEIDQRAFLWSLQSGLADLGRLTGTGYYSAYSINASGAAVGHSPSSASDFVPVVWSAPQLAQQLVLPTGYNVGVAYANNNNGSSAGYAYSIATDSRATVWDEIGNPATLAAISGPSHALDLNDNGAVVGDQYIFDPSIFSFATRAFFWSNDSVVNDLGYLNVLGGAVSTVARAINASDQVVGTSGAAGFIWDSGHGIRDLNTLLAASAGVFVAGANDINANGQIAGYGIFGTDSAPHAMLLVPVSEPASWLVLLLAVISR